MYLSTRISRLCKRSPFLSLSLSLYISVCVCVWLCVWLCVCVCVCVCVFWIGISELVVYGGDGGDYFPPGFQNYFLFPLSTSLFFLFFDDIPPPCNGYKAAPIFSSLSNVYVCVCSWLSTSVLLILTGLPNFLDYWYICIIIYK